MAPLPDVDGIMPSVDAGGGRPAEASAAADLVGDLALLRRVGDGSVAVARRPGVPVATLLGPSLFGMVLSLGVAWAGDGGRVAGGAAPEETAGRRGSGSWSASIWRSAITRCRGGARRDGQRGGQARRPSVAAGRGGRVR